MDRRSFLATTWAALLAHERRHRLLSPRRAVLAAVSGGPDSVCLAHYLFRRSRKLGFPLSIAHVHHGLRGKRADADAASVRRLAATLGVPYLEARVDAAAVAKAERRSREDAARAARYRALARLAREMGAGVVATGHTLSDQAETLILHLLRGTRASGLAGVPVRRPMAGRGSGGVHLVRPLLAVSREEIHRYLAFFRLKARHDETNRDISFTRNWVRHKVIPLLKKRNPRLERNLGLLSADLAARLAS